MVLKEDIFDNKSITSACTSDSSESYTYLLGDIENPSNHINEEWEAIERTLYQENGKHVTDPALLKECQLWRETFPHIRVRGTGISTERGEDVGVQAESPPDADRVALSRLSEKQEKVKQKVVSQLVERLVNRLNAKKEECLLADEKKVGRPNVDRNSPRTKSEKESYFERGKIADCLGKDLPESRRHEADRPRKQYALSELFDDFEYNFSVDPIAAVKRTGAGGLWSDQRGVHERQETTNLARNEEILRAENLTFRIAEKTRPRPTGSLSNMVKPFEMTKKIDRRYEAMLERILENKASATCIDERRSAGGGEQKIPKQLPRLKNHWLTRGEQVTGSDMREETVRSWRKSSAGKGKSQSCRSANDGSVADEKFLEELRKKFLGSGISARRGYDEEISLRRPQLTNRFAQNFTAKTQKSSSCGDLQKTNLKTGQRTSKSGLEKGRSEHAVKSSIRKNGKGSGAQGNMQLPPIESSIICTEIVGRPKISTGIFRKKYL